MNLERSVVELEELAHELSNSVAMTMNNLVQATALQDAEEVFNRIAISLDQAMHATTTLRKLMMELRSLRLAVFEESRR